MLLWHIIKNCNCFYFRRAATVKYTRSWQDTKAYTGAGNEKVKRGSTGRQSGGNRINKNNTKSTPVEEYNSEFPTLDNIKPSTSLSQNIVDQQVKPPAKHQEKNTTFTASVAGPSQKPAHITRTSTKYANSPQNRNYQLELQNTGNLPLSPPNKNFFVRPSNNYIGKEKDGTPVSRDSPSATDNSNMFNRKLPQYSGGNNQHHNFKQYHNNTHAGHGHNHQQSSTRGRNFHQYNNNSPQFNRDRYFSKGVNTQSHNSNHHNTVGSGRIQHSGGGDNYQHYSQQCK